ncbi:hypothetical protein ACFVKB_41490 [Rhodococcus sp. NPDC127530]
MKPPDGANAADVRTIFEAALASDETVQAGDDQGVAAAQRCRHQVQPPT